MPQFQHQEHHDRLSRLEEQTAEVAQAVAAQQVAINNLSDRIYDGFDRMNDIMEALHSKLDSINFTQADHRDRLIALESEAKRAKSWVKVFGAIVAAVVGWIGQAIVRSKLG